MDKTDTNMTLDEAKNQVRRFCEARAWDVRHGAKDLAIGLVTEASELLEIFRFKTEAEIAMMLEAPDARQAMADELADSLYFILRFAQLHRFDLAKSLRDKEQINAAKYPVD